MDVALVELGEHEHRLDPVQLGARRLPEVERDIAGDVAAEAVDAGLPHPIFHRLGHVAAQAGLVVVQVDDVGPVPPQGRPLHPLPVALVPVGVLGVERVVPGGMVGHPVEDDVHPLRMCGGDERLEVGERPELGIDRAIVAHRIGAAERALAMLDADRIDRHQPDDADAQCLQPRQLLLGGAEGAFGGELAGIDLVEDSVFRPVRMADRDIGLGRVRVGSGLRRCTKRHRHRRERGQHRLHHRASPSASRAIEQAARTSGPGREYVWIAYRRSSTMPAARGWSGRVKASVSASAFALAVTK